MSGLALTDRHGTVLLRASWLVAPLLVAAATAVALVCLRYAASDTPVWPVVALLLLALLAGLLPDTGLGLLLLGGYCAWWVLAVDDPATPWAFPAAVALLVVHAVLAHASAGPGEQVSGAATRTVWLRETALVALATSGVASVAALARGTTTTELVAGVGLVLLAALVWLAWRD